jgi:hypothetical protein
MPWSRLKKHRPLNWTREEKPDNRHDACQPSTPNASVKTKYDSEEVTKSPDAEDPWSQARQRLTQDKKTSPILEEATMIVEGFGLKVGSHGAADYQQLHSSLSAKVEELKQKELVV